MGGAKKRKINGPEIKGKVGPAAIRETKRIPNWARIRIDGTAGMVEIL